MVNVGAQTHSVPTRILFLVSPMSLTLGAGQPGVRLQPKGGGESIEGMIQREHDDEMKCCYTVERATLLLYAGREG